MIILIGSQKGGCGKSTTAANICAELARQGKDVILVDADRQGTASNWVTDRNGQEDLPVVHSIQKFDNIRETLLDLAKRYEYVVVDSAGRDSRELRTGMTAANVLLVPFRPSQPDLDTLPKLNDIITQALDINEALRPCAVLTMAPTNPVINETQEAKDYLADFPILNLLNTVIRDRKIYRDCMSEGKGVVEMDNGKAKAEIQCLVQELISW
ncbi:cobyrinic acid ac-diamide synthase [Chimaeribacter arupi]|uniref:Cobyrinic acid ac-diamide synthase n=2 Tax=Yersiniaceae TaxID=1903411 RepID=A0A2N5ENL5_9GAMM|nr:MULTISPECIES: AAA family ATPase [Yersiniaceae]MBS0969523.1 AAA family ATPase [Nissabacter archeti]PLR30570.1 cobyrinic acid ac-diamide synthase [Chimaeribacter arupi]PLR47609.1 cobyrinic acid ac-diamide synthase [Chimaeribacter arupi]PLR50268.1 cobyrinic acid ac-diamide synthase [Chimaeribacter arupi]PLR53590.1 cobyrinic acid ac-diamide synthase [Chimaeribacter arupi]